MGLPGSGAPVIVYNTRERLISSDPNRAQQLAAQWSAEFARFLLDTQTDDTSSNGVEIMGVGNESFLRGVVISGLRVRPDIGTTNTFITAGAVALVDNQSPGADDSVMSIVADAGVALAGALTLTPGAGSTRIDVVECQRVTNVLESDNRDIFNTSTGLFAPVQVTKKSQGQLVYRIRLGTPGSGFPGTAAGWLPLMVARVPAGAASWDVCDCWDVRPLACDRSNSPALATNGVGAQPVTFVSSDVTTNVNQVRLTGKITREFGGYRVGGNLAKSTAAPWLDITDSDHLTPGFIGYGTSIGRLWHLYLVFPFGLPRWCKYTDSASGSRLPGGLRGIPAISTVVPNFDGTPASSVSLQTPLSTGLLDSAGQPATCILVGLGDDSGTNAVPFGVQANGRVIRPCGNSVKKPNISGAAQPATDIGGGVVPPQVQTWNFNRGPVGTLSAPKDNTTGLAVPGNARSVLVHFATLIQFPTTGGATLNYEQITAKFLLSSSPTAFTEQVTVYGTSMIVTHNTVCSALIEFDLLLPLVQPPASKYALGNLGKFSVAWHWADSGVLSVTSLFMTAYVLGWEAAP
jgi:hypothetical protein